jgi:hypothetical protein
MKIVHSQQNICVKNMIHENKIKMEKPKIKIDLIEYDYDCADGCCTTYGTITKVNDIELQNHNQDTGSIVQQILEHLGYEVELNEEYKS